VDNKNEEITKQELNQSDVRKTDMVLALNQVKKAINNLTNASNESSKMMGKLTGALIFVGVVQIVVMVIGLLK